MRLNEFLEVYPIEIDYELYHKLDETYGDDEMDEHVWAKLLINYEQKSEQIHL